MNDVCVSATSIRKEIEGIFSVQKKIQKKIRSLEKPDSNLKLINSEQPLHSVWLFALVQF